MNHEQFPQASSEDSRIPKYFLDLMRDNRQKLIKRAAALLKGMDQRIGAPIDDIAKDIVQGVFINTAKVFQKSPSVWPTKERFVGYLWEGIRNTCISHSRSFEARRVLFGGSSDEMGEFNDTKLNRDTHEWIPPVTPTPEEIYEKKENGQAQAAWDYVLGGRNTAANRVGFEKPSAMKEEDFKRGLEIIRGYMLGGGGLEIAYELQKKGLLSSTYDLENLTDRKKAINLIQQTYRRMMEHLRKSMEADGFLEQLQERF